MTIERLGQLRSLKKEIQELEKRLSDLEALATGMTQTITGMPFVKGISDKTSLGAEIADIRAMLQTKRSEALQEYKQLMEYISGVQDSHMRRILTFRFVDGDSWTKVAAKMGGNNTADCVKKAYYRFSGNNMNS